MTTSCRKRADDVIASKRQRFTLLALGLCSVFAVTGSWPSAVSAEQQFPDVVAAKVTPRGGDVFDFDVTVSSPYDTAKRYADAFRVIGPDGKVLGERKLWHDHAGEQPFTRDLYGVMVPQGARSVTVQARDQKHGYGGKTIDVALPGR